jgi:hypothetical protein
MQGSHIHRLTCMKPNAYPRALWSPIILWLEKVNLGRPPLKPNNPSKSLDSKLHIWIGCGSKLRQARVQIPLLMCLVNDALFTVFAHSGTNRLVWWKGGTIFPLGLYHSTLCASGAKLPKLTRFNLRTVKKPAWATGLLAFQFATTAPTIVKLQYISYNYLSKKVHEVCPLATTWSSWRPGSKTSWCLHKTTA